MTEFIFGEHSNQNLVTEDIVVPFALENNSFEGRIIRLGPALNTIMQRHQYPDNVSRLLAELLMITALLGASLKENRTISTQMQGDGVIRLMLADCTPEGNLRSFAQFDDEALLALANESPQASVSEMMGTGHIIVTMENQEKGNTSQGIIELTGETIKDCLSKYFTDSQQLEVLLQTAVTKDADGQWQAGSILVQHHADAAPTPDDDDDAQQENWNRIEAFVGSLSEDELADASLPLHDVLYRLFHEEGVRVFSPHRLHDVCRCSRDKVENMLLSMSSETREEMKQDDGIIRVVCQFCSTEESFSDSDLVKE